VGTGEKGDRKGRDEGTGQRVPGAAATGEEIEGERERLMRGA
jgi:hypothetical protein